MSAQARLLFSKRVPRVNFYHLRRPRIQNRRFCEPNPSTQTTPPNAEAAVGRAGLNKASFVFRRLLKFACFVGVTGTGVYLLHEKEIMYKFVLKRLLSYKGKTGKDDEKPFWGYNMLMMLWGWSRSWQPYRFYNHLGSLIELLGPDYPDICRQASLMVLMQIMSFDPSMPPPVQYDKCFFKQKLLQGSQGEAFMQAIYNLCTAVETPEVMMMGFDLLTKFPLVPPAPSEELVQRLMKEEDASREIVFAALQRTQDPLYARGSIRNLKGMEYNRLVLPNFPEIKRLMLKHRALEFALNLWNSDNNMFKQCGYQMIPVLISDYPDEDELMSYLGETSQERSMNCRVIEEVLLNMGQNHYMRKESVEALKAFEEAEKFSGGKSAPLAYLSGLAHKELGNLVEAEENFGIALGLSRGKFSEARLELSNILLKGGEEDIEKAVQHLTILSQDRNNPKLEEIYFRLLFGLEKLKEYDTAFEHMTNLTRLKPNNQPAKYEAGRMGNLCQEYDLAEPFLRQSLKLSPASIDTKYQLALSLFQQGFIEEETSALLQSVLKSRPDHVKSLQLLSRIAFEQRNYEESLSHIEKILVQKPNLLSLNMQKAEILERLYRKDEQYGTYRYVLRQWQYRLSKDSEYFQKRPKEQAHFKKMQLQAKRKHISQSYQDFRSEFKEFLELNTSALCL